MDDSVEVKPRWGRRLAIAAGVLVLLLVVVYFVATSAWFLKSVILPRAGKQMNAQITVEDASISPFSQVTLHNLKLTTTGSEPLITAKEVRLRYSLMDIIKSHINVSEATLDSPTVLIVKEADGTSNLDPLMKGDKSTKEPSTKAIDLDVKNVALKNATVRITQKLKGAGPNVTELTGLNVTLDQLKTGGNGKLTIASDLRMSNKPAGGSNQVLAAKISGGYDFGLATNMAPSSIKGSTRIQVTEAQGGFAEAANLVAILEADVSPTVLNQIAFRFEKSGQQLGQLRVHGPFDLSKLEGSVSVELLALDRNVLNLAGAGQGLDFGKSTINSTNKIEITRKATFLAIDGRLSGSELGVVRDGKPTPPVDLGFDYKVGVDLTSQTAALEKILVSARHRGSEFLNANVDRPLNLSWGESKYGLKDSTFRLTVTNLNLADWAPLLGTNPPTGVVNVGMKLRAQEDGRKLGLDVVAGINDLGLRIGTNMIQHAKVSLVATGAVEEIKRINIAEYQFTLSSNNVQMLQAKGAARYDTEKKEMGVQILSDGVLPALLGEFPMPGIAASHGFVKLNAAINGTADETKISGQAQIDRFTGTVSDMSFNDFQTTFDYTVEVHGKFVQIHRASLSMAQGFNKGGTIDVNGSMNTGDKSGKVTFKIVELNQVTLGPALAASLGQKKLISVSMNSSGAATFSPGTNEVQAELNIEKLLVQDPAGSLPDKPLSVGLNVDASMRGNSVDLRNLSVQLTPTERATNKLQITAKLDLSKTNPAPGNVSIKSAGLDVTPYYDIFAGNSTNAAAKKSAGTSDTAVVAAQTDPNAEPAAMDLPIRQMTGTLALDRVFLREVAISNWVATVVISNNNVTLSPLKMGLNGAPVSGDVKLNLGVPGYTYDIALTADRVPLEPFANSFGTANKGQYKGLLIADAKIRGAGTKGASLQKNLQGQANFSMTNLDMQIVGPKLRRILVPISVVLQTPELLQSPINWVDAQTTMGDGKILVKKGGVESEAFFANATGEIAIDKVLTNSTLNLPVALSLRKSLAQKVMAITQTGPDEKFTPLPQFVTIKGTLGKPDPDINKLKMGGLLLNAGVGIAERITGNSARGAVGISTNVLNVLTGNANVSTNKDPNAAGKVIQGVGQGLGSLLGGNKDAASTNAPSTNKVKGLLNNFLK